MEIELLNLILKELNTELGFEIYLCHGYSSNLSTSGSDGVGFKLCKKGESPERRLNLILGLKLQHISEFQFFNIKERVRQAIIAFWDGENISPNSTAKIII